MSIEYIFARVYYILACEPFFLFCATSAHRASVAGLEVRNADFLLAAKHRCHEVYFEVEPEAPVASVFVLLYQ